MFVFLVLFCVCLIVTSIGLYLSFRSHTRIQRTVADAPRGRRGVDQRNRTRNVRLNPVADEPYHQLERFDAPVRQNYGRQRFPNGRMGVQDDVDVVNARFPRLLKLVSLSGPIFILCLLLFARVVNVNSIAGTMIFGNSTSEIQTVSKNTTLSAENLGVSNASKSIVRIAALDRGQYGSDDEYNTWAYSICSTASMTEILNAYGRNYHLTDVLKVEVSVHGISPELGLLEDKGIDRTMAQFGFKMVPLQNATLDGAIAIANQGHPVIVSFRNSDYWRGGHILVLRGGDAQNVELADSSRLNLTVIPRSQFLQWWGGFVALTVPQ